VSAETTVVRGGMVLDGARFLGRADLFVRNGRIAEVAGPNAPAPDDAEIIDASRNLVHPGLVNAHTHGHGNLSKSMGDRWTLELLLAAAPWISNYESVEEKRLSATIGAAEMVLKGCTGCYDLFVEFPGPTEEGIEAVAAAYRDVGMRAVIAPMVADLTLYQAIPGLLDAMSAELQQQVGALRLPPWEETVGRLRGILRSWAFDAEWQRPAIAPTIPLHCQDAFLVACRDLAREFGVGTHSHIAESKVQAVAGLQRYGRSPVAHIEALGLLGPRFTAAHGVWLGRDDRARLGDHGCSVAHNPVSNMRLGNGVADMTGLLDAGANVGIGTDAATCSDNLNMYAAMHVAALSSHARGPDPQCWVTASQVVEAATTGSAQALGFDHTGRIAPGYAADLVFLDLEAPTLVPLNDPVNQLVFGEEGTSVQHVMIGGRFVVRDRKLLTVDMARIARRAAEVRAVLDERGRAPRQTFACIEPVLNDFCPALSATRLPVHRWCGCDDRGLAQA
jgi:5-methylthioadenosine/S-adenosylhomocysteine deaminase